jgi:two-component system, LytTR family, sensor kinase
MESAEQATAEVTIKRVWLVWAVSTALFATWALLYALSSYLWRHSLGLPSTWREQFMIPVVNGIVYAAITPPFFLAALRFPLERGLLRRRVPLYVFGVLVFVFVHSVARLVIFPVKGVTGWIDRFSWVSVERAFLYFLVDDLYSTYLPLVAFAHALIYYRRLRSREMRAAQLQIALAQTQLQALKGQIHPHFLFNTMNSISALMHVDVKAADSMICRLSQLLRTTLETTELQEIALSEELEFLDCYLKIEETRFQDRIKVLFDIDPQTLSAQVPHLLLQPLVENALHHGMSKTIANGEIRVIAKKNGENLQIMVEDNGPGFAETASPAQKHPGVGLKITRERLLNLYGKKQQFRLENARPSGVRVNIEIPFTLERMAAEAVPGHG